MSEETQSHPHEDPELYVSVDLDGIHHHLLGYGIHAKAPEHCPVYELAIPRMIDVFEKVGVRPTLFAIAEDASDHAEMLRAARDAGCEIGSHSVTHPTPFDYLTPVDLTREVETSRELLEEVVGAPVRGFRTPGWGASPQVLAAIARAGYAYDSSIFPSPAFFAGLLAMKWRLGGDMYLQPSALRYALSTSQPYFADGLWEIPVTVTPVLRLPYYHTLDAMLGAERFEWLTGRVVASCRTINYTLHAIDFLGRDEIDERLLEHPGGDWPLERKLERVRENLTRLLATHPNVQLGERYSGAPE